MVDAIGEVKTPLFHNKPGQSTPKFGNSQQIDDTIAAYLEKNGEFEFSYKGNDYKIVKEYGNYVAYDSNGNTVDPNVQINSKNTIDGFIEVRGLYESGGEAVYIGNDPDKSTNEIRLIEASPFLDREHVNENPYLNGLMAKPISHSEQPLRRIQTTQPLQNEQPIQHMRPQPRADFDEDLDLKGDLNHQALISRLDFADTAAYQQDDDRSINKEELGVYLREELDISLTQAQLADFFQVLDQNDSGNIREAEVKRQQNSHHATPPADRATPRAAPDKNTPSASNTPSNVDASNTRFNVSRNEKSPWSRLDLPAGEASVQYESLNRPYRGKISTDGADYLLIIKSGGKHHHRIDNPGNFFGTRDGKIIGAAGSKDKGMMLIDVSDLDKIQMDTGDSSVQIMRIKTDEKLTVLNDGRGALDNDLVRGGRRASESAIKRLGHDIDHRRVEAWDGQNNLFTVYADDESKYDQRVEKYGDASEIFYYGGDDSAYLLPPGARADKSGSGSGNGAIIHIGVV